MITVPLLETRRLSREHEYALLKAVQNPSMYHEFLTYLFGPDYEISEDNSLEIYKRIDLHYNEKPSTDSVEHLFGERIREVVYFAIRRGK